MTEITWKLNEVTGRECRHLADNLQLPQEYVGCQIRGGDKITETNLLPAEYYIRLIKQKTDLRDVFVLTDDYRIFRQVQSLSRTYVGIPYAIPARKDMSTVLSRKRRKS